MIVPGVSWRRLASLTAAGVFLTCMWLPQSSVVRPLGAALLVLGMAFGAWYVSVVTWKASQHVQLVRSLKRLSTPATVAGLDVRLVDDVASPFVAGIFRPAIYCPANLPAGITPAELWAVLLHEDHHRLNHAPLRLLAIEALESALTVGPIQTWAVSARAAIEVEADLHAMGAGADQATIASALLNLAAGEMPSTAGFGAATEIRLRALIDGKQSPRANNDLGIGLIALVASLVCVAFYVL